MKIVYADFETAGIQGRPDYPPEPAGVAIRRPQDRKSKYYAWGHPTGNNCSKEDGIRALQEVWSSDWGISFHHAKFDLDVAETHLGLPMLPWQRVHDTMILAFLVDPHAKKIGLKELAEQRLGVPPTERDEVRECLITHGFCKRIEKGWGAHIAKAPGDLVGKYACGDTDRTKLIFESLYPEVKAAGMLEAYDRERKLIPVLLANEREGVRVDLEKLRGDVASYDAALQVVDQRLYKILGQEFNLDSDAELADVLDLKYPGIEWPLTGKGSRSTSKDSLAQVLVGKDELLSLFVYRATTNTCVNTFMRPWLLTAEKTGGRIHTSWNSVAQSQGGGTRTGRLSSTPNFQNIPTIKSPNFTRAIALREKNLGKLLLPTLPEVRSYIVADSKNEVLLDRDFSQQEVRVLAHFEDDKILRAYQQDPHMDLHSFAAEVIFGKATPENRKATKLLAFGMLYGLGLGGLAERLGCSVAEAKVTRAKYLGAFPGIKEIQQDLELRSRQGLSMTTWGGRKYLAEVSKLVDGRMRDFGYRLFNYLIQGSSADITKEAILRYDAAKQEGRLRLTVHDQLIVSVPKKAWKNEMKLLKEAMEGVPLGVPLTSDGSFGYRWTEQEECE